MATQKASGAHGHGGHADHGHGGHADHGHGGHADHGIELGGFPGGMGESCEEVVTYSADEPMEGCFGEEMGGFGEEMGGFGGEMGGFGGEMGGFGGEMGGAMGECFGESIDGSLGDEILGESSGWSEEDDVPTGVF
jgi:hypothetical protein